MRECAHAIPERAAGPRPDVLRRVHGASALVGELAAGCRPGQHRRDRHHPAAGGGQHDGRLRAADGRDGGPPGRRSPSCRRTSPPTSSRRWSARSSAPTRSTTRRSRWTPHTTVGETLSLLPKRAHGLAVVVQDGRPLGTVSEADATGVDRFAQAHEVMSSDLLTVAGRHLTDGHLRQPDPSAPGRGAGDRRRAAGRGHDAQARTALDPLPAGAGRRWPVADRGRGGHQR